MALWGLRRLEALYERLGVFIAANYKKQPMLNHLTSVRNNVGMAKRRSMKMADQIRQAIDDSGLTRYRISKETGIDESTLAKFYNGHRGLSMDALNRLGEYLGLRIVMDRKPNKKGR